MWAINTSDNYGEGTSRRRKGSRGNPNRHPPHLKGKEIGLFYAKRNRNSVKRKAEEEHPKSVGTILLSHSKKEYIQNLLDESSNLEIIQNRAFRNKFINLVNGSIEDKLKSFTELEQDPILDKELLEQFRQQQENDSYKKMKAYRETLPSYEKREEILKLMNENQVIVISGETGCGKTTQIPQFILDYYLENEKGSMCHIICTQPRRISAISVAERVAEERKERIGESVGYKIRLEREVPRTKGSIIFCTTGIVLRQMGLDPCLSDVSHIILDEIHERDIMSDFLIALLKQVLLVRKDLKLILMSATLNSEKFSNFYDNCPHINIPGFTYPVEELYLEDVLQRTGFVIGKSRIRRKFDRERKYDDFYHEVMEPHIRKLEAERLYSRDVCIQLRHPMIEEINNDMILHLLLDICKKEGDEGAILIFLPGFGEISSLHKLIEQSRRFPSHQYLIIPLHSQMPTVNQRKVFDRPPNGVRKIIIATNIAETSITIDDVVFVIDCGKIKLTNFDVESNTHTLKPEWVSLANASQRKGRAGRVRPGICFHLFSRARNMVLEKYQKPEILRSRLENTILTIKMLQLGKVKEFLGRVMDSPAPDAIDVSLRLLERLEALDENENLTPLGCHLAELPLAPQIGKMILLSAIFSCVNPILSIAATLDFKDPFQIPLGKEREADKKRMRLSEHCKSDHLLFYQAINHFESLSESEVRPFCWQYFLSYQTLRQLVKLKRQFMEYLHDMNFVQSTDPHDPKFNFNSENTSLIKAIICAGLYPNIATVKCSKFGPILHIIEDEASAKFHTKSVLCKESSFEFRLVVFHLKLRSSRIFIHDGTIVNPLPLIFFGDHYNYHTEYNNQGYPTISIGSDKLRFNCTKSTNDIIKQLRDRLNLILEYKVNNPSIVDWDSNDDQVAVLRAIIELITCEDTGDIDFDAF